MSSKLGKIGADETLGASYEDAKSRQSDIDRLNQLMSMQPTDEASGATKMAEQQYFHEKFGAAYGDQNAYNDLLIRLSEEMGGKRTSLYDSGISFPRVNRYEEKKAEAEERTKALEEARKLANEHPVSASVASVIASPAQGLGFAGNTLKYAGKSNLDHLENYEPMYATDFPVSNFVGTVRGTVSQKIEESTNWELFGQNVASFLYNTGMSVADSATQIAALGPYATYVMGMSAASNGARDVVARGGSNGQALAAGLASGAAEAVFEKFSIDNLLTPRSVVSVKRLLIESAKQAGVEASEEIATEIANILFDAAIMGQNSHFNIAVRDYISQGMSEDEAKQKAYLDNVAQVAWSGAGGILSGGIMGGAMNGMNYAGTPKINMENRRADASIDRAYGAMNQHGMFSTKAEDAVQSANRANGLPTWRSLHTLPVDSGMSGQQKTASTGETVGYTPLEADAIRHEGKTFRNMIAGIDSSVSEFFSKWRLGRKGQPDAKLEKLYLGRMDAETRTAVADILGYEVGPRDFIITNDGVKHILDTHGDPEVEVRKGNAPLTQAVIDALPNIVTHPDAVRPGNMEKSSPYRQGVIFEKTLPDGTAVYIQFDNSGRGTFEGRTLYVKTKESPTSGVNISEETNTSTSKTTEPELSSDPTIAPGESGVKIEDMQSRLGIYAPPGESIDSLIERMYNEMEPDHSELPELSELILPGEQALIDREWDGGEEHGHEGGASDFGAAPVPVKKDATFQTKIPAYAPLVNESVSKAARHTVLKGAEHNGEHLVLVDSITGDWVFEDVGDDSSVGNSGAFRRFVEEHPEGRFTYVHSHPSGDGFSLNDMAEFFGGEQFDSMVAAGYNGKVYTVYGKRARISVWSEVMKPEVDSPLLQDLRELRKDGKISEEFFKREVECRRVQYLIKCFCAEMEAET